MNKYKKHIQTIEDNSKLIADILNKEELLKQDIINIEIYNNKILKVIDDIQCDIAHNELMELCSSEPLKG